jgi:lipoprotein LprG
MIALVLSSLLAFGLAACGKDDQPSNLPDGAQLMSESATAMRGLNSAHVAIEATGQVGSLPLRSAEGDLTKGGDAKGTIKLSMMAALLELDFVVVGPDYYIKGLTGGWQKASAADVATFYDPSAILDPDRGVAKTLGSATNAHTEGADSVNGVDTYRVSVSLDSASVDTILPGVPAGVTGTVWVERTSKRLARAVLKIPAASGDPGTVTINLTNLDKPVAISAPK